LSVHPNGYNITLTWGGEGGGGASLTHTERVCASAEIFVLLFAARPKCQISRPRFLYTGLFVSFAVSSFILFTFIGLV